MQKIKNIDFLRIILLFVIILFHIFQKQHLGTYFPDMSHSALFGDKAVEMFFVMSGFFLVYTFKNTTSFFSFIKKKVIRFVPLLVFMTFCYWILSLICNTPFDKYNAIFEILMLNNIGITTSAGNIGGSWFISVLFFSSVVYFIILKIFDDKKTILATSIVAYISLVLLVTLTHGKMDGINRIYFDFINIGVMRGLSCVGLGCLVGFAYKFLNTELYAKTKIKTILYSVAEIYLLIFLINNLIFHQISTNNKLVLVFAFIALFWLFLLKRGFLSSFLDKVNFLSNIAKYSLSIYISHLFTFKVLMQTGIHKYVSAHSNIYIYIILFVLYLASAVLIGIFVYHLVEFPSTKYLKNMKNN